MGNFETVPGSYRSSIEKCQFIKLEQSKTRTDTKNPLNTNFPH